MSIQLNMAALKHARRLISDGKATCDVRDDWSDQAPDFGRENTSIDNPG
jgi:hypothetical protein